MPNSNELTLQEWSEIAQWYLKYPQELETPLTHRTSRKVNGFIRSLIEAGIEQKSSNKAQQ